MKKLRVAKFRVTRELFVSMLRGGGCSAGIVQGSLIHTVISDLPSDLEIVDVKWDAELGAMLLTCQSMSFPELNPNTIDIPEIIPTFRLSVQRMTVRLAEV